MMNDGNMAQNNGYMPDGVVDAKSGEVRSDTFSGEFDSLSTVSGGNGVNSMTMNNETAMPQAGAPDMKPKKEIDGKKFWMGAAIVFGVLMVVGVAFGVVMMMNGNKKAEELSLQVEELEEKNDDLLDQLDEEISKIEFKPIQLIPVLVEPADYIYVGEWGIKIKKPENWQSMIREYVFYNDYPQGTDVLEIKEDPEVPTAHALIMKQGETSCEGLTMQYDACFTLSSGTYIVTGLPSVGTGGVTDGFRNFVLNSENYLSI